MSADWGRWSYDDGDYDSPDEDRAADAAAELRAEEWAERERLIAEGKCPDSGLPEGQCVLGPCDCFIPVAPHWRDGTPVPTEPPEETP